MYMHCIYTVCTLYTQSENLVYEMYIHHICNVHTLCVQSMCVAYTMYIDCICNVRCMYNVYKLYRQCK